MSHTLKIVDALLKKLHEIPDQNSAEFNKLYNLIATRINTALEQKLITVNDVKKIMKKYNMIISESHVGGAKKNPSEWLTFLKIYSEKSKTPYREAMPKAAALYKQYKELKGGGLMDTINDFIAKYIAGPIGKAALSAIKTRFSK